MSGQNRTGGFPRRHRTQRATIANRQKDCTIAWLWILGMGGLIRVYAGSSAQWKKTALLQFQKYAWLSCASSDYSLWQKCEQWNGRREREGWLQITIYNILSSLVHIVPIYLEAASFSKYEYECSYWGWGALYSIFGSFVWGESYTLVCLGTITAIIVTRFSERSGHMGLLCLFLFSCIISLHSWLKLSWSSGFQKPLVNIRRFQFQESPTKWRQG